MSEMSRPVVKEKKKVHRHVFACFYLLQVGLQKEFPFGLYNVVVHIMSIPVGAPKPTGCNGDATVFRTNSSWLITGKVKASCTCLIYVNGKPDCEK